MNADGYVSTGQGVLGTNMFAYCGNNPVNMSDNSGQLAQWLRNFCNKVKNGLSLIGNSIKNGCSTVGNSAEKVGNAFFSSLKFEIGWGYGFGTSTTVGPVKANIGAYHDRVTLGYKNNESYTSIKGSAGIGVQSSKRMSLSISTEYEHRYETNGIRDLDGHNSLSMPWSVYNCPKTKKTPLQVGIPIVKPLEGDFSDELFIGISGDVHVGVGGHFAIGWDIDQFIKALTE